MVASVVSSGGSVSGSVTVVSGVVVSVVVSGGAVVVVTVVVVTGSVTVVSCVVFLVRLVVASVAVGTVVVTVVTVVGRVVTVAPGAVVALVGTDIIAFQSIPFAVSLSFADVKSKSSMLSPSRSFLANTTKRESEYSFEQVESTSSLSPNFTSTGDII